ncbi:MAG: hypothetical protein LBR67_05510 [Dysgonamonadaceae bacterium]|jgi:hypothetical protein|nr:hypothetical protein [Dysgonamonadaceae bacterium]
MERILKILCVFAAVAGFIACADKPEISDYIDPEELRYAGKANDLAYFAGYDRLLLQFVLSPDPNVNKAVIYWDLRADSTLVDINRAALTTDTINCLIENLPENTYSFEIFTYDIFGNRSVPAYLTARTYGIRYVSGLLNRQTTNVLYNEQTFALTVNWSDSIAKSLGTNIEYTALDDVQHKVFVGNTDTKTVLENVNIALPVMLQTLFVPEPEAIDNFGPEPEKVIDPETMSQDIPKPYAIYHVSGFDPDITYQPDESSAKNCLWDGKIGTMATPLWNLSWAVQMGYCTVYTSPADASQPTWMTFDIGARARLQQFHLNHYWPFAYSCMQQWELYAFNGSGAPTAADGWNNWIKIGEYDNSSVGSTDHNAKNAQQDAYYAAGEGFEFQREEVPVARYYRVKCLKNWDNQGIFTLGEISFRKYMFE